MKIATVQFDSRIGELRSNIERVDSLLRSSSLEGVQLLVGPELAFTGYNYPSLQAISSSLEPTCGGPSAWWAAKTARSYGLVVSIGYPEITTDPNVVPKKIGKSISSLDAAISSAQEYTTSIQSKAGSNSGYWTFNSTLTIGPDGDVLAHYRKTHLYYTDVTWVSPSIEGFSVATIPFSIGQPVKTSFAICMDLNPKAFTADWQAYEVATSAISKQSSLLVVSTAWMTRDEATHASTVSPCCPEDTAAEPDMDSLMYWIERLVPLIKQKQDTTVVIANRIGQEQGIVKACDLDKLIKPSFTPGSKSSFDSDSIDNENAQHLQNEDSIPTKEVQGTDELAGVTEQISPGIVSRSAHYAGSSTVLRLGHGKASIHGVLGQGIEGLLIADTSDEAIMTFRLSQGGE